MSTRNPLLDVVPSCYLLPAFWDGCLIVRRDGPTVTAIEACREAARAGVDLLTIPAYHTWLAQGTFAPPVVVEPT